MKYLPVSTIYNTGRKTILSACIVLLLSVFVIPSCKKVKDEIEPTQKEIVEDESLSAGSATIFDESVNAFGRAIPGISSSDQARFSVGNSFFRDNWVTAPATTTSRDGLGPIFNSSSCSGCHFKDGRGRPPLNPGEELTSMLVRISISGTDQSGGPKHHPVYGEQLGGKSILKVLPEVDVTINYQELIDYFHDGERFALTKPTYSFSNLNYGSLGGDILFSPRVAQQMPGLGLLEAIDENTIRSFADESDANGDGISGRPNFVMDYKNNQTVIGRFGWKANQPHLLQQTAAAFNGDIGITSNVFPDENFTGTQKQLYPDLINGGTPEISDDILNDVVYYISILGVPARRNVNSEEVIKGKNLFKEANCNGCHIPKIKTGKHPTIPELSNQEIRPYTDLLLHDMGPELADGRPDFAASGSEWRTPPLWGIGMVKTVNNHTFFLHDGRARSLEEAILWHGGEGEQSKNFYKRLSKQDRQALIKFLESL